MEDQLQAQSTLEQKINLLKSLTPTAGDCAYYFRAISRQKGDDNYKLLQWALETNLCGLFPQDNIGQLDKKTMENLYMSCSDFAMLGVYCRHIVQFYEDIYGANSYKSMSHFKVQMKSLGEFTDKLIVTVRKQGDLQKQLYVGQKQLEKQSLVIDLIINLTPEYLQLNPELFSIILLQFSAGVNSSDYDAIQLNQLALTIKNQCNSEENMNINHDWMMLMSSIFEQVYRNEGVGMLFILKNIDVEILRQVIIQNEKYLILNYFNSKESTLQILFGLTNHYITKASIEIIREISNILMNQVIKFKSRAHLEILIAVYHKFILTRILGNIQMFQVYFEMRDLLEFYIVGISQIESTFPPDAIDLMVKRLNMLLSLRFSSRDFFKPTFEFIETIKTFYPDLQNNRDLLTLQQKCQSKSSQQIRIYQNQNQNLLWQIDERSLKGSESNFQLLEKHSDSYIGLENLGNSIHIDTYPCFMNSFIQSLFMNQQFREIILKLKLTPDPPNLVQNSKNNLIIPLQKVFMLLTYQNQGFGSPYELKRSLREPYGTCFDQQDVGEFGLHFLEDLTAILPQQESQLLESLFMGSYSSILKCGNCGNKNEKGVEKFIGLALHFKHKSRESISKNKDIKNMIREFFESELLDFKCQKCNISSDRSTKQNILRDLPPFLMLTLQRFTYDVQEQRKTKMLDKVLFEFSIDMKDVFPDLRVPDQDSFKYDLYAFIIHLGQSSDSGHYITYARQLDKEQDTWVQFDDTMIQSKQVKDQQYFDEQLIDQETPYVLFYRNRSSNKCDFSSIQRRQQ